MQDLWSSLWHVDHFAFFFFFKICAFLWLYRAFVASGGLSVVAVCGLVIAVPSLVV